MESNDDFFMQKKIELMLDLNNKKFATELQKLNDQIIRLSGELNEMRKQLNGKVISHPRQETLSEAPKAVSSSTASTKSDDTIKPRFGDYKPGDVNISDFFYFGSGGKR